MNDSICNLGRSGVPSGALSPVGALTVPGSDWLQTHPYRAIPAWAGLYNLYVAVPVRLVTDIRSRQLSLQRDPTLMRISTLRSEERRVGKECKFRWSREH